MIVEGWIQDREIGRSLWQEQTIFSAGKFLDTGRLRRSVRVGHSKFRDAGRTVGRVQAISWLRHPNYVGVAGELAGAALMAFAPLTGVIALVLFGALMLARISIEERALGLS